MTDQDIARPRTESERVTEPGIVPMQTSAFPDHEHSTAVVETVMAPGFDAPIVDPETGEVTVLVHDKDEELRATEEKVVVESEYPKRVPLHGSHTTVQRRVPMQGFLRDADTGHLRGLEQAPPVAVMAGEWPKWVVVHDGYVVRKKIDGAPDHVGTPLWPNMHVNRADGVVTVLVNNEAEEKRALAAPDAPKVAKVEKAAEHEKASFLPAPIAPKVVSPSPSPPLPVVKHEHQTA